ncbi:MAG: hypothetical protein NC924_01415 [Candidatus Omnitrophica bacterium]|nr:hypothetical protein [Candidatus Omnitrophota bacterium]
MFQRVRRGMTLVELQLAATMIAVVLMLSGTMFYFGLALLRYLYDGFETYSNALAVAKAIHLEGMVANRYGWRQSPAWNSNFFDEAGSIGGSVYGTTGIDTNAWLYLPTLLNPGGGGGYQNDSPQIVFRQPAGNPLVYNDDVFVGIFRDAANGDVWIERANAQNFLGLNPGSDVLIGQGVVSLLFHKRSFNSFNFEVHARGAVVDPLAAGQQYNQIVLRSAVTLRCAPLVTCEPMGADQW